MKKLYVFRLLALLLFMPAVISVQGCSEPPTNWDVGLKVTLPNSEVGPTASSQVLRIESDGEWNISVDYISPEWVRSWVTLSKSNDSGNATVTVSYPENAEYDRNAKIVVKAGSIVRELSLRQTGKFGSADNFPKWTELPEISLDENLYFYTHYTTAGGKQVRNYSVFYDKSTYTAYWAAYPMHKSYMGSGRTDKWGYDPRIPQAWQVNYSSAWGANYYDRGHQVASADRNATVNKNDPADMNVQTFYYTNITPQRYKLNQQKWQNLEALLQKKASASQDTIWVVTGALHHRAGMQEDIFYLKKANGAGVEVNVPVPNYYYKVALWHKTPAGGGEKRYTAIGFWMPNKDDTGTITSSDALTVREVEQLTGFNFFANLPVSQQNAFETTVTASDWF